MNQHTEDIIWLSSFTEDYETIMDRPWFLSAKKHYNSLPRSLIIPPTYSLEMGLPPWAFLHHSEEKTGLVTFIDDPLTGRRKTMKVGRLLHQKRPEWGDDTVRVRANALLIRDVRAYSLELITDPAEGLKVYREMHKGGLTTCMSHSLAKFSSTSHPMLVLLRSPDIAVAVLRNIEKKITARALVNTTTKQFPMIYGDQAKLETRLVEAGFIHGPLDGATLPLVKHENSIRDIVMPYIDGQRGIGVNSCSSAQTFDIEDGIITLGNGPYIANSSGGVKACTRVIKKCSLCETEFPRKTILQRSYADEPICDSCVIDRCTYGWAEEGRNFLPTSQIHATGISIDGQLYLSRPAVIARGFVKCITTQDWIPKESAHYSLLKLNYISIEATQGMQKFIHHSERTTAPDYADPLQMADKARCFHMDPETGQIHYYAPSMMPFGVAIHGMFKKIGHNPERLYSAPPAAQELWALFKRNNAIERFLPEKKYGEGEIPAAAILNQTVTSMVDRILAN